ncbi:hypothetical protein Tco_0328730 [Tanacetum coccineum]
MMRNPDSQSEQYPKDFEVLKSSYIPACVFACKTPVENTQNSSPWLTKSGRYKQKEGIDFEESFAPVACLEAV